MFPRIVFQNFQIVDAFRPSMLPEFIGAEITTSTGELASVVPRKNKVRFGPDPGHVVRSWVHKKVTTSALERY